MVSFAIDPPMAWQGMFGAAHPASTTTHGSQSVQEQIRLAETLVHQLGGRDLRAR